MFTLIRCFVKRVRQKECKHAVTLRQSVFADGRRRLYYRFSLDSDRKSD